MPWPTPSRCGCSRTCPNSRSTELPGDAAVRRDTKHLDLVESPVRHVYVARAQAVMSWQGRRQSILMRVAGDPFAADRGLVEGIRQSVWQVDPEIPIANLRSMQQVIDKTVRHPRLRAALVVALLAGWAPARRAVRIDPASTLNAG